jgi:hypothetical protein
VNDFVLEEVEPIVKESMDKLLKEIKTQFDELDPDKTIRDYFIIVKDILQQYSDGKLNQDVSLLVKLVDLISRADIISTYNNKRDCVLVKEMKSLRGGRIRKKYQSCKKIKTKTKTKPKPKGKGKNSRKNINK